jgi:hypothetical protein
LIADWLSCIGERVLIGSAHSSIILSLVSEMSLSLAKEHLAKARDCLRLVERADKPDLRDKLVEWSQLWMETVSFMPIGSNVSSMLGSAIMAQLFSVGLNRNRYPCDRDPRRQRDWQDRELPTRLDIGVSTPINPEPTLTVLES